MKPEDKAKAMPSDEELKRMGYSMVPTVSVHVQYKSHDGPIWLAFDWNREKELYEVNPMRRKVTLTKTRQEMAEFLEGLIHDPEISEFTVKWGKWGHQLQGLSGWYDGEGASQLQLDWRKEVRQDEAESTKSPGAANRIGARG